MTTARPMSRPVRRSRMSLFASERSQNEEVWNGYERIVGFDTMPDAEDSVSGNASYTLQVKAKGYARTKHTRTFMCAVDATESRYVELADGSERALEWIMHNLVDDGDEIVAVRVLDGEQDGRLLLLTQTSIKKRHVLALAVCYPPSSS